MEKPYKVAETAVEIEKTGTVSSPERIARILHRVVQGALPLIIRIPTKQETAVRGKAVRILEEKGEQFLRIGDISDKGISYLVLHTPSFVQVEFVLATSKVVFSAPVISREMSSLVVRFPDSLVSIERRKNARFPIVAEMQSHMLFEQEVFDETTVFDPPLYLPAIELYQRVALSDISLGGACLSSNFPGLLRVLQRGYLAKSAKLILPLSQVTLINAEVKWTKRIKDNVTDNDGYVRQVRSYRIGIEFIHTSPDVASKIAQYISRLQQAGAL